MGPDGRDQDDVPDFAEDDFDEYDRPRTEPCYECGGTGEVPDNGTNLSECEECNVTGVLED